MGKNSKLDSAFRSATRWNKEAYKLRDVLLDCDLGEELKWGKPCYVSGGKNICIIQRMRDFLALMFFKGALLKDPDNILEAQGPSARVGYRMRFTSVREVEDMAESVKAYVQEAIRVEEAGLKPEKGAVPDYPEELIEKFEEDPDFEAAFDELTPGRRRGYVFYFSEAKQSKTRAARIGKCRRKILDGKGLQET